MDEDEKRMLFNEINILKEIVSFYLFAIRVFAKSSLRGLWWILNVSNLENNYTNSTTIVLI